MIGPELTTFIWGAGASIAVEIVSVNRVVSGARRRLPKRYRSWIFWLCRGLLALTAGALALAHGVSSDPWPAIQIGAATPLLVDCLGRKSPLTLGAGARSVESP